MTEEVNQETGEIKERIVTDESLQKALDFLRNNARRIGDAKGEVQRTAHRLKVVKALEMKKHNDLSAAKAEVEALCSEEYQKALVEDALAAAEYEMLRALREAAAVTIEVWRTEGANYRAMKI